MLREAEVDDAAAIQKLNATEMGYNYTLSATRQVLVSILDSPRQHFIRVFDGLYPRPGDGADLQRSSL